MEQNPEGPGYLDRTARLVDGGGSADISDVEVLSQQEEIKKLAPVVVEVGVVTVTADHRDLAETVFQGSIWINVGNHPVVTGPGIHAARAEVEVGLDESVQEGFKPCPFRLVEPLQRHGLGRGVQQQRDAVILTVPQPFVQEQPDRAVPLLHRIPIGAERIEQVDGGLLLPFRGEGEGLLIDPLAVGIRPCGRVQDTGKRGKAIRCGKQRSACLQQGSFTVAVQSGAVPIGAQRGKEIPRVTVPRSVQERTPLLIQSAETVCRALCRIPEPRERCVNLRRILQFADCSGVIL